MPNQPRTDRALDDLHLLTDRAVETRAEDKLGIDSFVRRLVPPLLSAERGQSLVVGLYGEWGHGKTSALNLLRIALDDVGAQESRSHPRTPKPYVLRFTPWLYSSVETLLSAFFATLAEGIGRSPAMTPEARKRWVAALKAMSETIGPAGEFGESLLGATTAGSTVVAAGASAGTTVSATASAAVGAAVGAAAGPAAGAAAGAALGAVSGAIASSLGRPLAKLLQALFKGAAEFVGAGEIAFEREKQSAGRILADLAVEGRAVRAVVLIDDLDRAAGVDEVLAMLKLVKLVADLPNVTYVIAMDRERVEALLQRHVSVEFGSGYLDKIVQVPITLPPLHGPRLARLLIDDITVVAIAAGMATEPLAVDWNTPEFLRRSGYESLVQRTLRHLRDVARILNLFRFATLTGSRRAHLHPVDLLLLCTLQARYPTVYETVRRNRTFLLNERLELHLDFGPSGGNAAKAREAARRARLEAIAAGAGVRRPRKGGAAHGAGTVAGAPAEVSSRSAIGDDPAYDAADTALEILLALFPYAIKDTATDLDRSTDRLAGRIRSRDRFDGYFYLEPPLYEATIQDVAGAYEVLTTPAPSIAAVEALARRINDAEEEARGSLLLQLRDMIHKASRDDARRLATSLPVLLRNVADASAQAVLRLAVETATVLLTYRIDEPDAQRPADHATAIALLVLLVKDLPPLVGAEFARDLVLHESRAPFLDEEGRREIAAAGLQRAAAFFADVPNVFDALGGHDGAEAVWIYRHLAARTVAPSGMYPPLRTYLERLLREEPASVTDILSLAAGWGPSEPSFAHRPMHEVREVLGALVDLQLLDKVARNAVVRAPADQGRWPHLLEPFVAAIPTTT